MNMNKALQHLYKAISGQDTTKVNISKLLVDIHYAATGVECAVKNNWSKIIDSIATNWTGGGGSSDYSTCTMTIVAGTAYTRITIMVPLVTTVPMDPPIDVISGGQQMLNAGTYTVAMLKGKTLVMTQYPARVNSISGNAETYEEGKYLITGDFTITLS